MAHDWLTHAPVAGITRQECQKCGAFRWIDAAPVLETECRPKVDLIRPYGPGKFNTILDSYVYQVSLDGGCDDEIGSVDEGGWFGMMRNGRTIFKDHDPLLETLNEAEQELLTTSAGVIIEEDSQGFVYVTYYTADAELDVAWDALQPDKTDYSCNQCQALMINGVYCHETGCPNTHKLKVDGEWATPETDESGGE